MHVYMTVTNAFIHPFLYGTSNALFDCIITHEYFYACLHVLCHRREKVAACITRCAVFSEKRFSTVDRFYCFEAREHKKDSKRKTGKMSGCHMP